MCKFDPDWYRVGEVSNQSLGHIIVEIRAPDRVRSRPGLFGPNRLDMISVI